MLPERAQQALSEAIKQQEEVFDAQALANVWWGLVIMRYPWQQQRPSTLFHISSAATATDNVPSEDASAAAAAAAAVNDPTARALLAAVSRMRTSLPLRSISQIFYALARMNCQYALLLPVLRLTLEAALVGVRDPIGGTELATLLYSLGQMKCRFNSLPTPARRNIFRSVAVNLEHMTEQEVGNSVWGLLGQMGVDYSTLPREVRQQLRLTIVEKQHQLRPQALVAIMTSLGRSRDTVHWQELESDLRSALLAACVRCVQQQQWLQEQQLNAGTLNHGLLAGNILLALGYLRASLRDEVIEMLVLQHLLQPLESEPSSRAVYAAVNGLARMAAATRLDQPPSNSRTMNSAGGGKTADVGERWHTLHPRIQSALRNALRSSVLDMKSSDLASTMWALALLRFSADENTGGDDADIILSVMMALEEGVKRMNGHELAWTLWSLGRMCIIYPLWQKSLQAIVIERCSQVLQDMTEQELGLTLWSLNNLQAPINDLPDALKVQLFMSIDALVASHDAIADTTEAVEDRTSVDGGSEFDEAAESGGEGQDAAGRRYRNDEAQSSDLAPYSEQQIRRAAKEAANVLRRGGVDWNSVPASARLKLVRSILNR